MTKKNKMPSYLTTYTGKQIDPLNITADDIDLNDIAHSLSLTARFSGHTLRAHQVSYHSVLVSLCCAPEDALWGLLHDAAEAYISDVPSPIKALCPDLQAIEDRILLAVAEKFDLPKEIPASVWNADKRVLTTELRDFIPGSNWLSTGYEPLEGYLHHLKPADAERIFIRRYCEITRSNFKELATQRKEIIQKRHNGGAPESSFFYNDPGDHGLYGPNLTPLPPGPKKKVKVDGT